MQQLEEENIKNESQCPFKCKSSETHMHYMECHSIESTKKREALLLNLQNVLKGAKTHEAITRLILWGLRWYSNKTVPTYVLLSGTLNDTIQQAIIEQTEIGWDKVRRGFISTKWVQAQHIYLQNSKQSVTTKC